MTRKRGGAKKKGDKKKKTRRRSSLTQSQRRIRRNVQQDALDEAARMENEILQQQLGVPDDIRRQRAERLDIQLRRNRRDSNVPDISSSQGSDISMQNASQESDIVMDSPPKTPIPRYRRKNSAAAAAAASSASSPQVKDMDISPGKGLVPAAEASSSDEDAMIMSPVRPRGAAAAVVSKPATLTRQTSPTRPRGQGVPPQDQGNNGISMSVNYEPSTRNIPGWFSGHVPRSYDVPLFGYSSFSHQDNVGLDSRTYQTMMGNLDRLMQLYQIYVKGLTRGASAVVPGVIRFMEVYIHAHNGNNPNGCKICGKQDNQQGIRIELTIPSQGDLSNSYLRSIGFDLLPSEFFNNKEAIDRMKDVARVIPFYIIDLINKNNMGQIIREILYSPNQNGVMEEGDNVVCIPLDYYKGRSAGTDPNTRPFGFHKDTIDNKTFYVNLSFDNQVDMYSASLIQCHTDDVDNESQRCKRAIRFKLPQLGTIGFSDFLLAHTTPTGLCGTYSNGSRGTNIVCGALGRDTTIPQTAQSRIVRGSVGVNIQNVQGILPSAHSRVDGSRREWTIEFDTNVRGRLKRRDGSQIMTNRPNFIRSWFTFFLTTNRRDSSSSLKSSAAASSSSSAAASSSSSAAASSSSSASNKYELAVFNHNNNSIFSSPITVDLFHHPNSHDGQHTESLNRFAALRLSERTLEHPDNPARFFKIMEVNQDIFYITRPSVSAAFQFIIDYDNNPQTPNVLTGGKKRKRKKRKGRKTKKRKSQKRIKRKRSRKQKKRKSKRKNI